MQTLPRDDFPTLPESSGSADAIAAARLPCAQMVAKTQFAITGEDTRYFLNGAQFVLQAGLDEPGRHRRPSPGAGRRQARRARRAQRRAGIILPKKTLLELGRLLGEGDGDVEFEQGENHLFFEVGGRMLISRMIDGQFPAYERVIPKGNDKTIDFERDRLTSAVKRVALLSNERSRAVKFEIEQGQGRCHVEQLGVRRGAAKQLPVEYTRHRAARSASTRSMSLDFLERRRNRDVALEFKDEVSQAVMKPVGAEGYDYTYVIMPMRI